MKLFLTIIILMSFSGCASKNTPDYLHAYQEFPAYTGILGSSMR